MEPTITGESAFVEGLCRSYQTLLQRYLTQIVGSPDVAEDLAQESFERVHRAYRAEQVMFPRAMLYMVATNFARMHLRRRRKERRHWGQAIDMERMEEMVADQESLAFDRQVLAGQIAQSIAMAIEGLRPSVRDVFVLAHVQGKSRKEVAVALGVSERRVDKRMSKALRACRELMASRGIRLGDVDRPGDVIKLVGELVADRC